MKNSKAMPGHVLMVCVITLIALVYIYPVFLMFMNSVKPFSEVVSDVIALPRQLAFENYSYVIEKMNYGQLFFNNVAITVIGLAGIIPISALTAYILDRRSSKFTAVARLFLIMPMLIPFQTIMITLLKTMSFLQLTESKIGLGIQYWGFGIPMAVFICYNFMATIPQALDESAYMDGAGTLRTFVSVIFPLLKPVSSTIIVLNVMWIWNDFLLPLLMVNGSNETRTLILAAYTFVGQFNTQWHYAMTSMVLAVLPSIVFFVLFQKNIIGGVVAGAIKG